MAFLAVCQRSLRTSMKYCKKLTNLQKDATERCAVAHQLHLAQICAGYATNEDSGFNNKIEKLPYPNIEGIRDFDAESSRSQSYKQVKYGNYVFKECAEGFVHVYVQGYQDPRDSFAPAGYGVCFGENHPLNASGVVERRQSLIHSKLYGFLKAIYLIPKDLNIQKLCVCVDSNSMIAFVSVGIPRLSENSFRTQSGHLNKDVETSREIYNLLRSRQDILTLRMKYVSWDHELRLAKKLAAIKAIEAPKLLNYKRS